MSGPEIGRFQAFDRDYHALLSLLRGNAPGSSEYSASEEQFLYALRNGEPVELRTLRRDVRIDAGYASRILKRFERDGLVERTLVEADRRRQRVRLTPHGQDEFQRVNRDVQDRVAALLSQLDAPRRQQLLAAMDAIRRILGDTLLIQPRERGEM